MIYPSTFEAKIGFTEVRELLKERCISPMGMASCEKMVCQTDYNTLKTGLQEVEEFRNILQFDSPFPAHEWNNLSPVLSHLHIEGTYIEVEDLALLRAFIYAIIQSFTYLKIRNEDNKYPALWRHCEAVTLEKELWEAINKILDDKGNLRDNASPELSRLRHEQIRLSREADKRIRKLLVIAKQDGIVKDDAEMTIRDGRLCIPVNASYKRKIPGFVHDISATGQTVFIEPTAVFDTNNELKEMANAEKREILRILTTIADHIRPSIPNLLAGHDFLGTLDFIRAKAQLAILFNAVKPILNPDPKIEWEQAIHPLLFLHLKQSGKKAEHLDLKLDKEKRILIISGPNAGGKSICLKTVGLLQYMMQCGLLVPMREGSEMGIFHHFFIDMGDEQSIDDELSTYSSHLNNLKMMIQNLEDRSLFLIDEFGSGTEPTLGGAMAEALLENIYHSGAFGIITTHYGNLKLFPDTHPQAVNGAMLFDTYALRPLFKLKMGKPGSSFTYEIARKIGLPEEIIQNAISKSGTTQIDYERKLEEIELALIETESKMKMATATDEQLTILLADYSQQFHALEKERKMIILNAKNQAKNIIDGANKLIENSVREIKEENANAEKIKEVRQKLAESKEELSKEIEPLAAKKDFATLLPKRATQKIEAPTEDLTPIQIGDMVLMTETMTVGEITQLNGQDITLSFNSVLLRTTLNKVEKVSKQAARQIKRGNTRYDGIAVADMMQKKVAAFQTTLDMRGMRADEGLATLESYINEAHLLRIPQVKILHGTGTGVLRQIVRQFLSKQRKITSFHDEDLERGGYGITVVNF